MKTSTKINILFLIILAMVTERGFSTIGFEDATYPELIVSSRALAMGNAFISKVDDSSSPFYNPAGLGTVRYGHLHLSNFLLEANKDWSKQTTGGNGTDLVTNIPKGFSLDGTRELLLENRGQISHRKFQFTPNLTTRFFSLGYMYSTQTRAYLGAESTDQFEYADRTDHGPYAAANLSLFGGIFKIGISTVYLNRKEAIGEADPDEKISLDKNDYDQGSGFISTAGMRLTLPWNLLPTFSIVRRNAFGNGWGSTSGAGAPDKIKTTHDLGFSITPQIGKSTRVHLEVNYKDALGAYSDVKTSRRVMLGLELDFSRVIFFRLGYGDGFGSGGLGVRTQKVEFDLTTYASDLSNSSFRGKEDRRFVLGVSSGF